MDSKLFHLLNGLAGRSTVFDHLLRWATNDLPVVMVLVIAVSWFWAGSETDRVQRQHLALYALGAALLGLALSQGIGHLWFRERPYLHHSAQLLVQPSGDPSFPSDHAVGAFGLAVPYLLAKRRLGWVLLGLATLLALTRVIVGTHYPSDVLAGALLGTGSAIIVWCARALLEIPLAPCFVLARRLRLAA